MDPSTIIDRSDGGAADGFAGLGDVVRLSILGALARGTRCVCELQPRLGLAQNLLSYHLRILREAGLVTGRRSGRRIEYSIETEGLLELRRELDRLVDAARRSA